MFMKDNLEEGKAGARHGNPGVPLSPEALLDACGQPVQEGIVLANAGEVYEPILNGVEGISAGWRSVSMGCVVTMKLLGRRSISWVQPQKSLGEHRK